MTIKATSSLPQSVHGVHGYQQETKPCRTYRHHLQQEFSMLLQDEDVSDTPWMVRKGWTCRHTSGDIGIKRDLPSLTRNPTAGARRGHVSPISHFIIMITRCLLLLASYIGHLWPAAATCCLLDKAQVWAENVGPQGRSLQGVADCCSSQQTATGEKTNTPEFLQLLLRRDPRSCPRTCSQSFLITAANRRKQTAPMCFYMY